jgi:predicted SprT family Zn-dependent metalloprotease
MPHLIGSIKEFIEADATRNEIWLAGRGFASHYINTFPTIEHELFNPNYKVYKNNKLWTTCGKAFFRLRKIELHPGLFWEHSQFPNQINETFFHELAHLIANLWAQHKGHGKEWRQVMRSFGYKPAAILRGEAAYAVVNFKQIKQQHAMGEIEKLMQEMGGFGE